MRAGGSDLGKAGKRGEIRAAGTAVDGAGCEPVDGLRLRIGTYLATEEA